MGCNGAGELGDLTMVALSRPPAEPRRSAFKRENVGDANSSLLLSSVRLQERRLRRCWIAACDCENDVSLEAVWLLGNG